MGEQDTKMAAMSMAMRTQTERGRPVLGASQTPLSNIARPPSTVPTTMWSQHAHAALAGPCETRDQKVLGDTWSDVFGSLEGVPARLSIRKRVTMRWCLLDSFGTNVSLVVRGTMCCRSSLYPAYIVRLEDRSQPRRFLYYGISRGDDIVRDHQEACARSRANRAKGLPNNLTKHSKVHEEYTKRRTLDRVCVPCNVSPVS
ncbi:hypothetical protein F4806DRAFT_288688 [Annulohypoxylon nitens]|nr:hypothetical protein F4806DRAFT_288688 [Annulohypoxylon nitens]